MALFVRTPPIVLVTSSAIRTTTPNIQSSVPLRLHVHTHMQTSSLANSSDLERNQSDLEQSQQARTETAGSTSSTRQPQPAQSNTLSPTSSTRTAPPLHTATFAEFECPVRERQIELDGGNDASFEAEQQQQHYQHQTAAVEFMTGIATAAAQAATASLEAQISAVISQLEGLPQALAREVISSVVPMLPSYLSTFLPSYLLFTATYCN